MVIRRAGLEDLANIVDLHTCSWQQNYQQALSAEFLQKHLLANRTEVWTGRLHKPTDNQLVLVAEESGVFCGFICVFAVNHPEYGSIIDNLHVSPKAKGRGIGSQLMSAAAQWLEKSYSGYGIYLEVLACNEKAIGFYQSRGGKHTASGYWHTPCGNKVEEFIYTWPEAGLMIEACA